MSSKKINPKASELPVNRKICKSCPFRTDKKGNWVDPDLACKVIGRTLFKGQQICHSTEGPNREHRTRCKGSYDYNAAIYERLGLKK